MKRKIIIASSIVLALLALIPLSAWWYVFHTQAGVQLALAQLHRLQRVRIDVADVSGTLAGALTIKRVEIDENHVNVVADNIELRLTPIALLTQTVRVDSITVAHARVQLKTFEDEPSAKPPRFFPDFLRLSVGAAEIGGAEVMTAQGVTIAASHARGALSLTSQRLHIDDAAVKADFFSAEGAFTLLAKRPVEMQFVGTARAPAGRGAELVGRVDFSGVPQSFRIAGELTAPSPATFNATLRREDNAWRTNGKIESAAFALTPWIGKPPFSLRDVNLNVTASNADVRVQGTVLVPELDDKPIAVDAQGRYADRTLHISPAALRLSDSDFAVTAQGKIEVRGERPMITAQAQWENFSWPLRSTVFVSPQGQISLAGNLPYNVDVDAQAHLDNGIVGVIAARGELSNTALAVNRYSITALEGEINGDGHLAFGAPQSWRVQARAANLNTSAIHEKLRGRVNVDASARGEGFGRDAAFAVDVKSLRGTLLGERLTASGSLQRESTARASKWTAKNIIAHLGADTLELNGVFGEQHDLYWRVDIESLDRFFADADGSVRSSGTLKGKRATPIIDAQLRGEKLQYGDWRADSLAVTADVDLSTSASSQFTIEAQRAGWRDERFADLRIGGAGSPKSHTIELQADLPPNNRARLSRMSTSASGAYANRRWSGTLAPLQLIDAQAGEPTIQAAAASIAFATTDARVETWCVLWTDRKLCAQGDWRRDGAWRMSLQSDPLPLHMFDGLFDGDARMRGLWQLQANVRAERNSPWLADAAVLMNDASLAYQPVEGAEEVVQLGSGRATFNATAKQFAAQLALATPGTTSIDVQAQVERTMGALADAPLTGTLRAGTADANLLPLLLVDLDHAAGNLRVDLQMRGTLGAPSLFGDVELARGELDMYRYNLALRDLGVTARIDDNRVRFEGSGRAGEGSLRIDGDLSWRGADTIGMMNLKGEQLLIADLPDYRVVASPDVRFGIDGKRIDVSGSVLIPSANIQPVDLRGAVQRSSDVRLINELPPDADRGFHVSSNIDVRLGDDVKLDTYGLKGKLGGAVSAITRPGEPPRGRGELSVSDGQYEAYGQDLDIERGRLLFDAAPLDNPGLDILAIRRVEDQRVGVNVRGTLRAPRLTLYADPSLPQTQIVAYLLTGKPVEDMRSSDTAAVSNATDALALQGGSLLASQLGRRIGLEHVSVESKGLDDTSLVLGKFLSPRLFVSYGISLTESFNTLKARYSISDRWLFKTEAGQHQSADVEFRIER